MCVSIKPSLLANHVRVFCTPLIQALNAHVLHTSMCYTCPRIVFTTGTSYERPCATDVRVSSTPLIQSTNVPVLLHTCATHVRVSCVSCTLLIQATFVCYTWPSVVNTTDTSNPRPCVGLSCEPLILATHRGHGWYKLHTSTRFFNSFFYYIRDLRNLHASFSICACYLNKTDGSRE